MGTPKALLPFDGASCLALVLEACRGAGVVDVVTVVAAGQPSLGAAAAALGARVVENFLPEEGQTSSLRAGVAALGGGARAFLIFPVDYPLVRAHDVSALLSAYQARAPGQTVFIPSHGGRRGHPVLVDVALAPALLALPPGASARDVLHAHPRAIVHVERPDDGVLRDMDTPEDYARCLARFRAGSAAAGSKPV